MEHSLRFERVKTYYARGLWSRVMVENAVGRWITREECRELLGEEAPAEQQ